MSGTIKLIENLIKYKESLTLPKGVENSLDSKLNNAIKSLEKGQNEAAIGILNAFVNEVTALQGKKLTNEQADELRKAAQKIISVIN